MTRITPSKREVLILNGLLIILVGFIITSCNSPNKGGIQDYPCISDSPIKETVNQAVQQPMGANKDGAGQKSSDGQQASVPLPGYTELVDASKGIVVAHSRDRIIKVIDASNPKAPTTLTTIDTPAFSEALTYDGKYFYVADSREILMYKNDFNEPILRYGLENFQPSAITVRDNLVYIVSSNELMILDVTDPKSAKEISRTKLTGVGPNHISIKDNYVYIVETLGGLNIVDVQYPEKPRLVKVIPFESHSVGFDVKENYAYLTRVASIQQKGDWYSTTSVFEVIDISRPESAAVVSSVEITTDVKSLDVEGKYAYVIGQYPYRLTIIDVQSPIHPSIIPQKEIIQGDTDFQKIIVDNQYAFIADGRIGLRIVEVSDPTNPKHVTDFDMEGRGFSIFKVGNMVYIGVEQKYANIIDARNPLQPKLAYTEQYTASYEYSSIVVDDNKAYFNGGEFKLYDVSTPEKPVKLNQKTIEADSIQVQDGYLYSTIGEVGLLVYDISDPAFPSRISTTRFPIGIPRGLSVDGHLAVSISNIPYSINVMDISDQKNPVPKQSYTYQQYPKSVTVKGDYIYVARGEDGADILGINGNGTIGLIANIQTKRYVHHVTVDKNKAFVISDGADVFNVSDPQQPVFLGHLDNKGEANMAAVDAGYMYVADGYAGITVIKI